MIRWPLVIQAIVNYGHPGNATDQKAAFSLLDSWVKGWRLSQLQALHAKMTDGAPDAKQSEGDLLRHFSLASSFFFCCRCRNGATLRYVDSRLGAHRCMRPSTEGWDFDSLVFDKEASRAVTECIKAAGRDPGGTKAGDMDVLNARFYCRNCPQGTTLARSWRNCVSSTLFPVTACSVLTFSPRMLQASHVKDHPRIEGWICLSNDDTDAIIRLENRSDPVRRFKCRMCTENVKTLKEVLNHIDHL